MYTVYHKFMTFVVDCK